MSKWIVKFDDILIVALMFSNLIIGPLLGMGNIAANIVIPAIFGIFLAKDFVKGSVLNVKLYNIFIIFFLWSCIASIIAFDTNQAYTTQKRILAILLYLYPIISYTRKSFRNTVRACIFFVVILVIILFLFFSGVASIDISSTYQNDFSIDRNTFGYYIFFGMFSLFILHLNGNFNKIPLALMVAIIPMCLTVLLISGSRGGFVIFIISAIVGVFILFNNKIKFNIAVSLKILIFIIITVYTTLYSYDNFFKGTYLYNRFISLEVHQTPRQDHFYEAIRVGLNNPIFGVGGGNYSLQPRSFELGNYSHNGFTEAFANYGFIGLILFVSLFVEYFKTLVKLTIISKNNFSLLGIHYLFLFAFVIYNFLYVTYLTQEFMGVYFVFRMHLEHYVCSMNKMKISCGVFPRKSVALLNRVF